MSIQQTQNSVATSQSQDGILIPQPPVVTDSTQGFRPLSIIMRFNTKVIKKNEMKTYRFYIMTLALSFLFAGCSEDELTKGPGAKVGDEVQFGLSLSNLDTRTVYGEENTETNKFPIYWVNGDKVRVASPQCLSGRNSAEYVIAVDGKEQNYATSMTKTGDAGVQWGDADKADFYSIYPSTDGTELTVNGDNVSAKLQVAATQYASITECTSTTDDGKTYNYYYAQPADMGNVVMYAKTTGVTKGDLVNLHYTPFSTVIEFEITAPESSDASHQSEITIQSLSLIAPDVNNVKTNIAGDFKFTFPDADKGPSIELSGTGSNQITLHFLENNEYTTVLSTTNTNNSKQTLKAKMCLMPISGVKNLAGWKVQVNTLTGTFTKTLTDQTNELKPGLVHKIKLPKLNYASKDWTYNLANWITSLPDYRNIYLSEISLPGAWYAGAKTSDGYQNTTSISELWGLGVRAFAFECRSRSWTDFSDPDRIVLSGTGSKGPGNAYMNTTDYIAPRIKTIADNIKSDEYGVLVLSYADGGEGGTRSQDYSFFIQGVQNEISKSGATNIYSGEIKPETTVDQVLGKLIIVVAVDDNITIGGYTGGMNSLLCYNPFPNQLVAKEQSLAEPHFSKLYWQSWADSNKQLSLQNNSELLWCFTSANRTDCTNTTDETGTITNTEVSTLSQRKKSLLSMGEISDQIYNASSHNVWFYFGAGGTSATSKSSPTDSKEFASCMNSWLLTQIKNKINNNKPSPLGIVMFNQCGGGTSYSETDYHGAEIIKNIIEMNSKFYLKHAGANTNNTGGSTEQTAEVTSLSLKHDSAIKDSGTNAISWK